ncbi:hypothetical protein Taro_032222 [Colocasia esculenta]|uniref:Uncharacterized protein n=1 Tax=Colocasia esculenta TaxID=4460 RepID=A0A843VQU7_COLES|nr:hypothetical protein [Colocasia esculenta]
MSVFDDMSSLRTTVRLHGRERCTLRLKDEKIRDLEEEIRDITVYIEAQKALNNIADADDIRSLNDATAFPFAVWDGSTG